jgi:ribonuclease D
LVTDDAGLQTVTDRFKHTSRIALDTEAASFHRYVDRVYLIQVSSDRETAIVDPLAVTDLTPLADCLASAGIEVVLHDADYDLRILDRDYGIRVRHVFDTRLAAQLAGEPSVGLGALLEKYCGVTIDKKFQRADWSRRPLPDDMIAYAADDTRYLPTLRDILERRLLEMGRLEWAREEFGRLEGIRWSRGSTDNEEAYLRLKGAKALRGRRARGVLRAVHGWREDTARALDRAPFRVVDNMVLLNVAKAAPTTIEALQQQARVPASIARRYGKSLLDAVREALALPESELPVIERTRRPPPDPAYDAGLERLKQLRNRRAEELGMDSGLLCPNGTLQALSRASPNTARDLDAIGELRKWQRDVFGDDALLAALHGT